MKDEEEARDTGSQEELETIAVTDWPKLTPRRLLRLAGRLTIGSWLLIIGSISVLATAAFGFGWAYRDGSLHPLAYAVHAGPTTPAEERVERLTANAFRSAYSDLVDWQKLAPIARGIMEDAPDGVETVSEAAALFLAQVRVTRGKASFLSGSTEYSVRIRAEEDGFALAWSEQPSRVQAIANDAGYDLSEDELAVVNSNLNWGQFSYLDDAMQRAVIYHDLEGNFGLVIRDAP